MYFGLFDPTMYLLIPAIILALWAQTKVSSTFNKYSKIANARGLTGSDAARMILDKNGLYSVKIQHISGSLTDNFDPRTNVVNLSDATYMSNSIGAIGVAAHECGQLSMPIILLGFILTAFGGMAPLIVDIGIILYSATVVFQLITLPVEFNASSRALKTLESYQMLGSEEIKGAKKVLSAAAMTYVAAAFSALMTLLRLVLLSSNNNRRD